jgi:glucan endo-1,3-alpha-glucosidase
LTVHPPSIQQDQEDSFIFRLARSRAFTSSSGRLVFAHYHMGYCARSCTEAGYEQDIQDAQAAGIDGFVLNAGGWSGTYSYYNTRVTAMYAAANALGTGFKLMISPDTASLGILSDADIEDMGATFCTNPANLQYQGKCVFSGWGVQNYNTPSYWRNTLLAAITAKTGQQIFWVPEVCAPSTGPGTGCSEIPSQSQIQTMEAAWDPYVDGYWPGGDLAAVPTYTDSPSKLTDGENWATVTHANGKLYMAEPAAQYWGAIQTVNGRRYYEYSGGQGIQNDWTSIINKQKPEWAEIMSWEDMGESYVTPATTNTTYPWSTTPHVADPRLISYYIQWYKTGVQPPITKDELFYFYRTHPKDAVASNDSYGPVTQFYGPVADDLYVTTFLTAPATLIVDSGLNTTTYALNAGITNTSIPFSMGAQTFTLTRNGTTIVSATGENIIANPIFYNFFYATGHSSSNRLKLTP